MTVAAVAKRAGVSAMTVSRVINGDPRVTPATAAKVRSAMKALDYVPPETEHDGRRRRGRAHLGLHTGRIGVLFPDTSMRALGTPLSARLLEGLDQPFGGMGLQLVISRLQDDGSLPNWVDRRQIDGLIIRGDSLQPFAPKRMPVPVVWMLDEGRDTTFGDVVASDDTAIGRELAERVLARDAGPVLVIDDLAQHPVYLARFLAIREVLGDRIPVRRISVPRPFDASMVVEALRSAPEARTVFIPGPNQLAIQVLRAIGGRKTSPWIVSCCNDRGLWSLIDRPMTNIDIQPEELAAAAGRQLLVRIANPELARQRIIVPVVWTDKGR